jgi:UDP-glucose 4-epimerase
LNILVTGGLGFVGSFLVERLVDLKHNVTVVDNLSTGSKQWMIEKDTVDYHIMDVVDFCATNNKPFDIIYHLANNARISMSFEYPKETLLNNYESTIAILEYMRRYCGTAKLYYASSSTTEFTDKFNNPYTFSKFTCDDILELYHLHYNIDYSIVKFYNVYGSMREADLGEYTTIIRKFKQKVEMNLPLPVYGPDRRRDFTSIEDTIDALEIILNQNDQQKVYHIGTGTNYSIQEIADAFDHPIDYQTDKRLYELHTTLSKPNITGWQAQKNVIDHIKKWKKNYAISN